MEIIYIMEITIERGNIFTYILSLPLYIIRYSGKTQKQIVEFVRDNYVKRQTFQR